jgi:ATP-binding cassette, subfamily B, multidrug efflux pump
VISLFRRYLKPYRGAVAAVLVLLLIGALGNLYLPELNGDIIDNGVVRGDTGYVLRIGVLMLVVSAALGVASVIAVYLSALIAMGFGRDVRAAVFDRVEAFSQVEVNRFGSASLITRNTNDVTQVQTVLFMGLAIMVSAPILIVGGVIMAIRTDVPLSGMLLVILPLMAAFIGLILTRALPLFQATQERVDRINRVMRETLAGVRVIRAFVRTGHEEARFDKANRELADTGLAIGRLFALTPPLMTAILNLSTVGVVWFGASRIGEGALEVGAMTAFLQYLLQILFAMLTAVFVFILVPRAAVSASRINEVLQTVPSLVDPISPVTPSDPAQRGVVEFRDVGFRYPGAEEPVLTGISFRAEAGRTTAIVGSTGSGKSTLINLVPRFYDATEGQVLVDGVDVRDLDREALWARLGVVPQKAFLFRGTVASNLHFGDADATEADLWRALDIAQARDFVAAMEGALDAPISQGGANLSGGQRQRLAIARAIARKAGIMIFDDSFSALDVGTDARLRAALARELSETTVIVVAQRIGTIIRADRIVVLDDGRVVGIGTHDELLASNETYREIVESQLSPAEAVA